MQPFSNPLVMFAPVRPRESGDPGQHVPAIKSWIPAYAGMSGRLALAAALITVAGCSEYLDRRDTIALSGGNAVETNKVTQVVDPWPRDSANREIAYNGEKIQSAVERYRTNKVVPPQGIGTAASYQAAPSQNNAAPPVGPGVTASAPVK